jgi:hypothetical protein
MCFDDNCARVSQYALCTLVDIKPTDHDELSPDSHTLVNSKMART